MEITEPDLSSCWGGTLHGDLEWHGCYGSGGKYNKYVTKESTAHPAKMSFELLERIFKHLESMHLLTHDSIVIDFMAGSGRTGTVAALRRYRTISVELEPHFIDMIAGYDCDGKSISDFRIEPCVCKSETLHRPHTIRTGLFEVECSGNPRMVPVCRCGSRRHHKKHHIIGNKELIEQVTGRKVRWDILKGDARELSRLMNLTDMVGVVSPPYFNQTAFQDKDFMVKSAEERSNKLRKSEGHYGSPEALKRYAEKIMETYSLDPQNIGNLPDAPLAGIISPPYGDIDIGKGIRPNRWDKIKDIEGFKGRKDWKSGTPSEYSPNPDNIGNFPDHPLVAIVSLPYQDTNMPMGCPSHIRKLAREGNWDKAIELERKSEADQAKKGNKFGVSTDETIRKKIEMALEREKGNYSENLDNIGNLKDVPLVGIMSPPYSEAQRGCGIAIKGYNSDHEQGKNSLKVAQRCGYMKEVHGSDPANIGNFVDGAQSKDVRESYLQAMLKVYQQAYLCGISPLVVITKNPTRRNALRRLDLDTIALLQRAGYQIFDYHRAILFETHTQNTLDGDSKDVHKGRISFFKRLSLEKGTTVAQFEDVIFARIPDVEE